MLRGFYLATGTADYKGNWIKTLFFALPRPTSTCILCTVCRAAAQWWAARPSASTIGYSCVYPPSYGYPYPLIRCRAVQLIEAFYAYYECMYTKKVVINS